MALKVGVVGMGGIGNRHAGCHAEDDLADLVAVCDVVKACDILTWTAFHVSFQGIKRCTVVNNFFGADSNIKCGNIGECFCPGIKVGRMITTHSRPVATNRVVLLPG